MRYTSQRLLNFARTPHRFAICGWRCFRLFKSPVDVLWCYVRRRPPRNNQIRTRGGMTLHLSSHPHDLVTAVVIWCKQEYGRVPAGSIVIDVGANIGMFALWAVHCGASQVRCYEPDPANSAALAVNIERNQLAHRIMPHQAAVSAGDVHEMELRGGMGPYSSTDPGHEGELLRVPAISFSNVMRQEPRPSFLKIDCEGMEYALLRSVRRDQIDGLKQLRMEYHHGLVDAVAIMTQHGFRLVKDLEGSARNGVAWFDAESSEP